jgi:excisionase family DNA binding protein
MKDYLSVAEIAAIWNISKRRVQVLCKEGRIPGAKIIGNIWVIPKDAEKPEDPRRKIS